MAVSENEFLLQDRIQKIQSINEQYDLEHNAYLSFSGGKDSTILHYLLDEALPGNRIPRVYINTGIEYKLVLNFVKELAAKDDRIVLHNSGVNIKEMLETKGYPFKSKDHSEHIALIQNGSTSKSAIKYATNIGKPFGCSKQMSYQLQPGALKFKVSANCCRYLKKYPATRWEKENKRPIRITGMRRSEGGQRIFLNCILLKDNVLHKFHPLAPMTDEWCNWYAELRNIKFSDIYYPPYNFERTGCKACPYSMRIQEELDVMKELMPAEYKQAEWLWKPVYDEYRRIGYRLRPVENELEFGSNE